MLADADDAMAFDGRCDASIIYIFARIISARPWSEVARCATPVDTEFYDTHFCRQSALARAAYMRRVLNAEVRRYRRSYGRPWKAVSGMPRQEIVESPSQTVERCRGFASAICAKMLEMPRAHMTWCAEYAYAYV